MTTNFRAAIVAILAAVAIAGCAGNSSSPRAAPLATPSAAVPTAAAFGTPERVIDGQGHPLTVTPAKAWWLPGHIQSRYIPQAAASGLSPAENGRFLIIEMKVAAVATPRFPAPLPARAAIMEQSPHVSDAGTNASTTCVEHLPAHRYSNVALHPGMWLLDGETYDVPPGPAVLAWLVGTQGGSVVTWQVPAHSTGPLPANVRTALKTGERMLTDDCTGQPVDPQKTPLARVPSPERA